jgi:hypothetical protein
MEMRRTRNRPRREIGRMNLTADIVVGRFPLQFLEENLWDVRVMTV